MDVCIPTFAQKTLLLPLLEKLRKGTIFKVVVYGGDKEWIDVLKCSPSIMPN